ncbi:MAG: hypothetical protein JNM47_10710 [Hyphomonadaceae bacterium]|nr:hypothetical protein [Hyphomonadaceae bacterium]
MIDRRVNIIGQKEPDAGPRTLSEFRDRPNYVLLGDPGSGKTQCFRSEASAVGADYLTTRTFLLRPTGELGGTLYIDALDEQRSGPADNSTVDRIIEKLFLCKPKSVRISCRSQDWLGDTDLSAFREYFDRHGDVTVLELEAISEEEQIAILVANKMSAENARTFLQEAAERRLDAFTRNPQKMLMLRRVVENGAWPNSARELFDAATRLQLREENAAHANKQDGQYDADELRLTAGGICAARLIADVEGLTLSATSTAPELPGYRTLKHLDLNLVAATLKRPLFSTTAANCVDYDHRTSAEYLAAVWIAHAVRAGLPIDRVLALMGVDGHPSSELRGLNAWLPHFLPEHAELFIRADPLGVMEYGDAASLSTGQRRTLLNALGELAATNPWFLSFQRHPPGLASLAQADNVDALCAILAKTDAPRDLRTIALGALESAPPLTAAFDTLCTVFGDRTLYWEDRSRAFRALLNFGDKGQDAVLAELPALAGDVQTTLRLRAEVIAHCYSAGAGDADIVALIRDLMNAGLDSSIGLLWNLADAIPAERVPALVDQLAAIVPAKAEERHRRSSWDVASFLNRLIGRAPSDQLTPARVLAWMALRRTLRRRGADDRDQTLVASVAAVPGLAKAAFNDFIDAYEPDEKTGRPSRIFHETVTPLTTGDELCAWCVERLGRESDLTRRKFLFDVAIVYSRGDSPRAQDNFEQLYALGQAADDLRETLEAALVCDLGWWYTDKREQRAEHLRDREADKEDLRARFAANRADVRDGKALGYLGFAAEIYFDLFADLDHAASAEDRLAAYLGDENARAALDGFRALVLNRPPPALDEIRKLFAEGRYYPWWYAYVAGVELRLAAGEPVADLAPDLVTAVLTMNLHQMLSSRSHRGDKDAPSLQETLSAAHTVLAASIYLHAVESDLAKGAEHPTGLYPFLQWDVFARARTESLLSLLDRFPDMSANTRENILQAAVTSPELADGLRSRAQAALNDPTMSQVNCHLWHATAFVLRAGGIDARVAYALADDRNVIWALRDFLGYERKSNAGPASLSVEQLQLLISSAGTVWPPADHPTGGWSGNTNPWDAYEFVRLLIDRLSAVTSADATKALSEMVGMPQLSAYHGHLKHALARQRIARREAEYDRPDWASTLSALTNAAPANAADLHALVFDHLRDLARTIDGSNLDLFKQFWNEKGHGEKVSPKPEESCRDALVALLRPRLAPLGLTVEPEGHMSADKRVDVAVARPGLKSLIEVKLAHSKDLWTAVSGQLDRFYTRDPDTKGHGILAVLWFGAGSSKGVTRPVDGPAPATPAAMEQQLREKLGKDTTRLNVIVVDVSGDRPQAGAAQPSPTEPKRRRSKKPDSATS